MQVLAGIGTDLETLANDTAMATEIAGDIMEAASAGPPRIEITLP